MDDFKFNTIDFDYSDKSLISKVLIKVWNCKYLFSCFCNPSQHKGFSISLKCRVDCDLCRFVFDDETRYRIDSKRKKRHQNIIWSRKEIFKLNERVRYNY